MPSVTFCIALLLLAVPVAVAQDNAAFCDTVKVYPLHGVVDAPELVGGYEALQAHVVYPDSAREAKIEGLVIVMFVIDTMGQVHCPEIIRGVRADLDEAALRAVEQMRFTPARVRVKKPVTVRYALPVQFELE